MKGQITVPVSLQLTDMKIENEQNGVDGKKEDLIKLSQTLTDAMILLILGLNGNIYLNI